MKTITMNEPYNKPIGFQSLFCRIIMYFNILVSSPKVSTILSYSALPLSYSNLVAPRVDVFVNIARLVNKWKMTATLKKPSDHLTKDSSNS